MNTETWTDVWRKWIKDATKFNVVDFYDWLEKNYEVPQKKQNVENDQQNESKCGL